MKVRTVHVNIDLFCERLKMVRIILELQDDCDLVAISYLKKFQKYVQAKGESFAVGRFKTYANYLKRKVMGDTPEPLPFCKSKGGWPVDLKDLQALAGQGAAEAIYCLTLANFWLAQASHDGKPDYSSIDGYQDEVPGPLLEEFRDFVRNSDLTKRARKVPLEMTPTVRCTSAQGIYGQSFYSIPRERLSLQTHRLRDTLADLYMYTGRSFMSDLLLDEEHNTKMPADAPALRRMTTIREPGNKIRYITIADFWSQNALLPIHNYFMRVLRGTKEDCTYSANEGCQYLHSLLERSIAKNQKLWFECDDLKSFTDFLPLSIQRVLVEELLGDTLADLWVRVLREDVYIKGRGLTRFTRGQPMGLLSSWAVASLTHHYLVRFANWKYRKVRRVTYRLLGDDITIVGRQSALAYRALLDALAIPRSVEKQVTSQKGFELCKRVFRGGMELTPAPVKSLVNDSAPYAAWELLRIFKGVVSPRGVRGLSQYLNYIDPSAPTKAPPLDTLWKCLRMNGDPTALGLAGSWAENAALIREETRRVQCSEQMKKSESQLQKALKLGLNDLQLRSKIGGTGNTKRIRHWYDPSTEAVYNILLSQYWAGVERVITDMPALLNHVTQETPTWRLVQELPIVDLDFYIMDPRTRFGDHRVDAVKSQLRQMKSVFTKLMMAAHTYSFSHNTHEDKWHASPGPALDKDLWADAYDELARKQASTQDRFAWDDSLSSFIYEKRAEVAVGSSPDAGDELTETSEPDLPISPLDVK